MMGVHHGDQEMGGSPTSPRIPLEQYQRGRPRTRRAPSWPSRRRAQARSSHRSPLQQKKSRSSRVRRRSSSTEWSRDAALAVMRPAPKKRSASARPPPTRSWSPSSGIRALTFLGVVLVALLSVATQSVYGTTYDNNGEDLTYAELLTSHASQLHVVRPGRVALHRRSVPEVHADDHIRLEVRSHNRTFWLHLQPDTHLLHPEAEMVVTRRAGEPPEVLPLRARVYTGHVVDAAFSEARAAWDAAGIVGHLPGTNPLTSFTSKLWGSSAFGRDYAKANTSHLVLEDGDPASKFPPLIGPGGGPVFSRDWNVGRARVVLMHDGLAPSTHYDRHYPGVNRPIFHANFDFDGEDYTVMPLHMYKAMRRQGDPPSRYLRKRGVRADRDATMVVYRSSDTAAVQERLQRRGTTSSTCGVGSMKYNLDQRMMTAARHMNAFTASAEDTLTSLFRRNPQRNGGGGGGKTRSARLDQQAAGKCPSDATFVYFGVASDCNYAKRLGNTEKDVADNMISIWNQVSSKYSSTFNVGVGIVRANIQLDCGGDSWNVPCSDSFPIASRLSEFSKWRGQQNTDEGLWHLLSTCNTGATLGIAWTGTLCERKTRTQTNKQNEQETVTGAGVSTMTRDQWKVVAHEIGHNFGAIHDCTSDKCSGQVTPGSRQQLDCCPCNTAGGTGNCDCAGKFLMNPTDNASTDDFSSCSIDDICSNLSKQIRAANTCLLPPGSKKLLTGNVCGNGILEDGEECDCGDQCANDQCCTDKCKLKPGAKCADRNNPGCCQQCQFRPAGTVCRASRDFCDIQEVCSGTTGNCPKDDFLSNGTPCTVNGTFPNGIANGAYCAQGTCTNRNVQCFQSSKGQRVQITSMCQQSQGDCSMTCANPSGGNSCLQLDGAFMDGTDCGLQGRCFSGQCSGSPILNTIAGLVKGNPTVSIVVGVLLGLSLLSCIYSCCVRRACSRMRSSRRPANRPNPVMASRALGGSVSAANGAARAANSVPPPAPAASAMYNEQQKYLDSLGRTPSSGAMLSPTSAAKVAPSPPGGPPRPSSGSSSGAGSSRGPPPQMPVMDPYGGGFAPPTYGEYSPYAPGAYQAPPQPGYPPGAPAPGNFGGGGPLIAPQPAFDPHMSFTFGGPQPQPQYGMYAQPQGIPYPPQSRPPGPR